MICVCVCCSEALCRALGLAGTRAAHAAVREFAALESREPLLAPAQVYLGALALAPGADDAVLLDVLRLGDEARAPALADSALLAAAAAAAARSADLGQTVRDTLARSLARCKVRTPDPVGHRRVPRPTLT